MTRPSLTNGVVLEFSSFRLALPLRRKEMNSVVSTPLHFTEVIQWRRRRASTLNGSSSSSALGSGDSVAWTYSNNASWTRSQKRDCAVSSTIIFDEKEIRPPTDTNTSIAAATAGWEMDMLLC